ncbi:PfkB family carbohydrate kinase [Kribbella ginsengisoli]|uniref:PfkB family carbohydrate kinase n=1 Tax=Kribbella ginsengisoli TaxID=363865 RepID=A0ABP6VZX0_9ACTN
MANPADLPETPESQVLTHTLLKLRMHDGLALARLQRDRRNSAPVLNLPVVGQFAATHHLELPEAALEVFRRYVGNLPTATHRIVADATLALCLYSDVYRAADVPERAIRDLESDTLGRRRAALLREWQRLHTALNEPAGLPPSDRTLRETVERRVLSQLAYHLTTSAEEAADSPSTQERRSRRVLVVGGAVMDAIFRTRRIPGHETSGRAHDFSLTPGGKGLTQAVAAARLGLDVALIAAIADDQFGDQIVAHLETEKVDVSLIKRVTNARTPFTGVFEQGQGDSIALIWRNEAEISLDVPDIDNLKEHLTNCDALLLTFEIPRETLQQALALAHADPDSRPLTIVTPGQPYLEEELSRPALHSIDYMVAHAWELEKYEPADMTRYDPDRVGKILLSRGVETLCFLGNGGGSIYSHSESMPGTLRLPTLSSLYKESSAARDAFCAALTAQLLDHNRTLTPTIARWATAAMATAAEAFAKPTSLPNRNEIEQRLRTLPS